MTKRTKRIGVFDSGFGGINILKGIVKGLPEYDFLYLGDNARTPYGTRSKEVIYEFTKQAVDFLFKNNCELIIIACNTASSDALRKIQQEYLPKKYPNKRVLGVLIPSVEEAVIVTKNNRVGVLATEGTVKSESFIREFKKLNNDIKVFQKACPLLVPLIESGEHKTKHAKMIVENYLTSLKKNKVDTIILGCTHYGIIESDIRKISGSEIKILSGSKIIPKKLKNYLERHKEIEKVLTKKGKVHFHTTDLTDKFEMFGSKFFGKKISAKVVKID